MLAWKNGFLSVKVIESHWKQKYQFEKDIFHVYYHVLLDNDL